LILTACGCAALYLCAPLFEMNKYYYGDSSTITYIGAFVRFLYHASIIWLAAAIARRVLDSIVNRAPRAVLTCLYWTLDAAYTAALIYASAAYAGSVLSTGLVADYEYYQYSMTTLIILASFSLGAMLITPILKRATRKRPLSSMPIIENVYPPLFLAGAAGTAHVLGYAAMYLDFSFYCKIAVIAASCYFCVSVLRGLILGAVNGDITGSMFTRPPQSLLERYRLFTPGLSFAERTGLSVRSMWSIGYAARLIPIYALAGAALLIGMTCLYTIEPYQEALLYRFGALREDSVKTPGLHFKLPWPIDRLGLYSVDRVRTIAVGYTPSESEDYLWTSEHGGNENQLLLGDGNELIAINLGIKFTISDVRAYATNHSNPMVMLDANLYDLMMDKTAPSNLDTVLDIDRRRLSDELRGRMNEFADANHLGVRIENVVISSIHPPIELADVYQGVVSASVQKVTIVTNAQAEAQKKTIDAAWRKESAILRAGTSRIERLSRVSRDMAVYENAFAAYQESPACYEFLRKLRAAQAAVANQRVYVFSPGAKLNPERYIIPNGSALVVVE
jgi:regulator of protease activity HflC (stomatin/prohibitin superfamily)